MAGQSSFSVTQQVRTHPWWCPPVISWFISPINYSFITLYHVVSCYITLYHVISCYNIMLYHVISRYITLYHVISRYITFYHVISQYNIMLYHVISRSITLYHVILSYITLYHVISTINHRIQPLRQPSLLLVGCSMAGIPRTLHQGAKVQEAVWSSPNLVYRCDPGWAKGSQKNRRLRCNSRRNVILTPFEENIYTYKPVYHMYI